MLMSMKLTKNHFVLAASATQKVSAVAVSPNAPTLGARLGLADTVFLCLKHAAQRSARAAKTNSYFAFWSFSILHKSAGSG